ASSGVWMCAVSMKGVRSKLSCLFRPVVIFFFSSRRRHTRFSRDWSSDVCSSDLLDALGAELEGYSAADCAAVLREAALTAMRERSEERRVGKECRSRWRPAPLKKRHGRAGGVEE